MNEEFHSIQVVLVSKIRLLDRIRDILSQSNSNGNDLRELNFLLQKNKIRRIDEDLKNSALLSNNGFVSRLIQKFPELTKSDLEICYWVYKGLDTKTIADYSFRSPGTIKVRRCQIRKKLGIMNGNKSLKTFLEKV